ncbi:hypothetical protein LTR08_005449 [Meristemomyces frigidus]|nr:hypothetical protein LTR08_005449 [Meristemomyces frigidus]
MAPLTRVHWVTPVVMVLSLLAGFAFALGHHLFYWSLDGKATPTGSFHVVGRQVGRQQLNISVGTTLAYLVKVSLAFAVTIAFVQAFWRAMKSATPTLAQLNSTFSALGDVSSLKHLWKHPLLLVLALLSW